MNNLGQQPSPSHVQMEVDQKDTQHNLVDYNQNNRDTGDFYLPQNAPPGAIPLRLPNQNISGKFNIFKLFTEILGNVSQTSVNQDKEMKEDKVLSPQNIPERDQSRGEPRGFQSMDAQKSPHSAASLSRSQSANGGFSESQPTADLAQQNKVASTFIQAAEEDFDVSVHTQAARQADSALNERLQQIEQKRKIIEAREREDQPENKAEDYQKDDKKEILERVKQIYYSLPKSEDEILKYPLEWNALINLNVIDFVMQKIVSRRVKDILHVEEPSLIRWVIDALKKKPTPQYMKHHLFNVLDEATDGFVVSIWKAMIFENKKIDEKIIDKPFKLY